MLQNVAKRTRQALTDRADCRALSGYTGLKSTVKNIVYFIGKPSQKYPKHVMSVLSDKQQEQPQFHAHPSKALRGLRYSAEWMLQQGDCQSIDVERDRSSRLRPKSSWNPKYQRIWVSKIGRIHQQLPT